MDPTTVEVIMEILLGAISGIFAIILVIRHRDLLSVAQHRSELFSRRIKNIRILLQSLNIALYGICLVLQIVEGNLIGNGEEDYEKLYALFWLPPIIIGTIAILIENQEFKLKVPLMIFHFIFYLLQFLISAALLLYFFSDQVANEDDNYIIGNKVVSRMSRAAVQFLIVLYYFYRKQDIQEFMDLGWIIWDLNSDLLIPFNRDPNESIPCLDDFSVIQRVDSDIEVVFASEISSIKQIPTFKVTVKLHPRNPDYMLHQRELQPKKYELQEEISQFLQLSLDIQSEMQNDLSSSETTLQEVNALNFAVYDNVKNVNYAQLEELRKKLQNLFDVLCCNPKYYYNCFFEFLQINQEYRPYYIAQKKVKRGERIDDYLEESKTDNKENNIHSIEYFSVTIEKFQEVGLVQYGFAKGWLCMDSQRLNIFYHNNLCDLFNQHQNRQEHLNYEITIVNNQNKQKWKLMMRYSELRDFHHKLKERFEKLPPFPQKKFITAMTPAFLEERLMKLKLFLEIMLNDDLYNQDKYVFNQLGTYQTNGDISASSSSKQFGSVVINPRYSTTMYSGWTAKQNGYFIQMEDEEKKGFTVYKFAIYEGMSLRGVVERRFKEFSKLHDYLELKFQSSILPELPPKISRLKTNIPSDKRQIDLEMYLNRIFQITGIGTCYYFRVFFREITVNSMQANGSGGADLPYQIRHNSAQPPINFESKLDYDEDIIERNSHNSQDNISSLKIDQLQEFGSSYNTK